MVRAAYCRSAGPWFKSGCALIIDAGISGLQPLDTHVQSDFERSANKHSWRVAAEGLRFKVCGARLAFSLLRACISEVLNDRTQFLVFSFGSNLNGQV